MAIVLPNPSSIGGLLIVVFEKMLVNFMTVQTMNVLTVPFTCPLHIGHFRIAGAQSEQQTRWPHGRNAMDALKSKHILHNC